jgi:hypothetical protein
MHRRAIYPAKEPGKIDGFKNWRCVVHLQPLVTMISTTIVFVRCVSRSHAGRIVPFPTGAAATLPMGWETVVIELDPPKRKP